MYHTSLIDTDQYKLSMGSFILKLHPRVLARYEFINRDMREFPEGFAKSLREVIDTFRGIALTMDEKAFIREKCYYLDPAYIDFLAGYRYDPSEVNILQAGSNLKVTVSGPMYRTIYWEVPLMATISELFFKATNQPHDNESDIRKKARDKAMALRNADITFSEFGTRRRYSYNVHCWVLEELSRHAGRSLVGTSNPHLAMKYNLTPMGTIAHEVFQLYGAMYGYQMANAMVCEDWVRVYQGDLGIALTDTFTTKVFLQSFGTKYAKLFDGVRHDSADPMPWIDMIVNHYRDKRIDPMHKTALFSDNLKSIEQILGIHEACGGRIKDAYGIGTWFSNDCGAKALNMVIKLIACDFGQGWLPTVKLSDNRGKNTGDPEAVRLCKETLGISNEH